MATRKKQRSRSPVEGGWKIPKDIRLDGEWLVYSNDAVSAPLEMARPGRGNAFLTGFLALGKTGSTDKEILKYAQRWGVLEQCERPRGCRLNPDKEKGWRSCLAGCLESLNTWRFHAGKARWILNEAALLARGQCGQDGAWILTPPNEPTTMEILVGSSREQAVIVDSYRPEMPLDLRVEHQRVYLAGYLDEWLESARIRPRITWGGEGPTIIFRPNNLIAALTLQLAKEIAGGRPVVCSSCSTTYIPARAPRSGARHNYCSDCRGAAAVGDHRKRKEEGKSIRAYQKKNPADKPRRQPVRGRGKA